MSEWVSVFTFKAKKPFDSFHLAGVSVLFFSLNCYVYVDIYVWIRYQVMIKRKKKTTTKVFHFEAMKHQHKIFWCARHKYTLAMTATHTHIQLFRSRAVNRLKISTIPLLWAQCKRPHRSSNGSLPLSLFLSRRYARSRNTHKKKDTNKIGGKTNKLYLVHDEKFVFVISVQRKCIWIWLQMNLLLPVAAIYTLFFCISLCTSVFFFFIAVVAVVGLFYLSIILFVIFIFV